MTADPFFSLKPKRLSDSAVDEILELIKLGKLPLGSKLPSERELITRLHVSRASLREAIRMLETMGVLLVLPGRGTWIREDYVRPISNEWLSWLPSHQKDLTELLEMRETLEVQAAALAAERATEEQLGLILKEYAGMQTALAANDIEDLVEADTRLHETIADASGNSILAQTLRSLSLLAMEGRRVTWAIPGHPRRSVPEHGKVVRAIVAKNKLAAAKAMFRHVRGAREEVLTTLSASVSLAGVIGVTDKTGNGKGVHG